MMRGLRRIIVEGIFNYMPVGQGLFYTGFIRRKNQSVFSMVYDCGSTSKLQIEREVANWNDEMLANGKDEIDLLVISHFDADHIKGLRELLIDKKVSSLVVPYANFSLNTIRLFSNIEEANLYHDEEILFYLNPLEEIISIIGDDNIGTIYEITPDEYPTNDNEEGPYEEDRRNFEGNDFKNNINKKIVPDRQFTQENFHSVVNDWKFVFINKEYKISEINIFFKYLLDEIFDKTEIRVVGKEDMLKVLKITSKLTLSKMYKNAKKRMKNDTEKVFSDINNSSLCMYHRPNKEVFFVSNSSEDAILNKGFVLRDKFISKEITPKPPGQLLLGDITVDREFIDRLCSFLTIREINSMNNVLIPHHGSILSWTDELLYVFRNANWSVSFKQGKRMKHPSESVISEIINSGSNVFFSYSDKRYTYKRRTLGIESSKITIVIIAKDY